MSEIAKLIKREPVDTFRKIARENVHKLAIFPRIPSRNVNE